MKISFPQNNAIPAWIVSRWIFVILTKIYKPTGQCVIYVDILGQIQADAATEKWQGENWANSLLSGSRDLVKKQLVHIII